MKNCVLALLLCLPLLTVGQASQATLLGHWDDETIPQAFFANPYHDVWGAVVNDKEIGIITSTLGIHFFDLSNAEAEFEPVAFAPAPVQGNSIGHRDVKTYLHYAYAVADEGASTLQVIDMSGLPESVEIVYESAEFIRTTHNIFIDEDNARLYAVGGSGFNLRILSLENPEQPELLASYPTVGVPLPYIHDLYVRDNIAYLNAGPAGFIVMDMSDPANPELLGTMTEYIEQGYNHSGWLSDDGQYYYLGDETHGLDIKIVDVSDLSNMRVVATMDANSFPGQIPHNVYPKDGLLYVSYYYDGLQVYDVSNPLFPRRVAYYDTYDGPDIEFFAGAWGVFVLPSGRVLISDMNSGLYFFEPIDLPPYTSVTPNVTGIDACVGTAAEFSIEVGADFLSSGVTLSTEGSSGTIEVQLGATSANPGEIVSVSVTGLEAGPATLVIHSTDGTNEGQATVDVHVIGLPTPATLQAPNDGRENVSLTPFFFWTGSGPSGLLPKRIQVSTDGDNFEENIIYELAVSGNSLTFPNTLEEGTTYYWRIVTSGECGDSPSAIYSFTTETSTRVTEIDGNGFRLYPNPANESVRLSFSQPIEEALQVEWLSANGQRIKTERLAAQAQELRMDISGLPDGLYLVRMSSLQESVSRRVLVRH
ncbi:MAG: choice-of-anchor B family protein [Lewinellaceae bacterium]|nr:choice-of-anchor B family protein [Phaeodactylibacter sp.]MCB0616012.1 choice-of-anchor B family protein [Phaeodactylibacter sp.]MCB9348031.1 choice-of-anchor B family protein [Lewinellaceae bacterium]